MTDPNLQLLLDRAAISDVVHAYATGLDRRDWTLFRSKNSLALLCSRLQERCIPLTSNIVLPSRVKN